MAARRTEINGVRLLDYSGEAVGGYAVLLNDGEYSNKCALVGVCRHGALWFAAAHRKCDAACSMPDADRACVPAHALAQVRAFCAERGLCVNERVKGALYDLAHLTIAGRKRLCPNSAASD